MTISIPDTLAVDNSGKYTVSIRLRPDGFSFSGYQPMAANSFFFREINFGKGESFADQLKETFFAHDFFSWKYKQVRIITETSRYTLVPENLYNEKRKHEFLDFTLSDPGVFCLDNEWNEKIVLYEMDSEVYEFCSRSFLDPKFYSHIVPQAMFFERDSLKRESVAQMYVVVRDGAADICSFRQGEMQMASSFEAGRQEDILYYILYLWKQLGLDQEKDLIFIHGKADACNRVIELLRTYLRNVAPVEIPSEIYFQGVGITLAPIDIIALSTCE